MDIFATLIVAIIIGIIAAVIGIIAKKGIWRILIYAIAGLIIGLPLGYLLAPFILSFY